MISDDGLKPFPIVKLKPKSKITFNDIPPGLDLEDITLECQSGRVGSSIEYDNKLSGLKPFPKVELKPRSGITYADIPPGLDLEDMYE